MSSLGGTGLRELAKLNFDKMEYFKSAMTEKGASLVFESPGFNEVVLEFKDDFRPQFESLIEKGIVAGLELGKYYPELAGKYLFCVTETISKDVIDAVAAEVK